MLGVKEIDMRHLSNRIVLQISFLILILMLTSCSTSAAPISSPPEDPAPTQLDMEVVDPTYTPAEFDAGSAIEEAEEFTLTSAAFEEGGSIPIQFSCDGEDVSPELSWRGTPEGSLSLVLIMDDPDAPGGTWVHWILFNMPSDLIELPASVPAEPILSDGSIHGVNSWGRHDYGGPCPPQGTHRYFFKLYALDKSLDVLEGTDTQALYDMMQGHILADATLMGTYSR